MALGASGMRLNDQLEMDFSERFRFKSWDNTITLDESAEGANTFTRHRTSLGLKWSPDKSFQAYVKLTNEFRHYFVPESRKFSFHEIVFDQLYINFKNPFNLPFSLTAGRQNLTLGEGFIMFDGGPLDGSRTMYFNAVRADWDINDRHRLTAFYSRQPETDDYLPVMHNQNLSLIEQAEEGFGLYYTGNKKYFDLQAYFIRKNIDSNESYPVKSEINTPGARLACAITRELNFIAEAAAQFGKKGDHNRHSHGGYTYLEYKPAWRCLGRILPYTVKAGGIYLSGDDPATTDWEDWDPMFARWPKWSESYIYTQINEDGVAYWTNLGSIYAGMSFKPDNNVNLDLYYYHLAALQPRDEAAVPPAGGGKTRGDLFVGKLSYSFNKNWTGHLLWEGFIPGNYYFENADGYSWLRTELMFKI